MNRITKTIFAIAAMEAAALARPNHKRIRGNCPQYDSAAETSESQPIDSELAQTESSSMFFPDLSLEFPIQLAQVEEQDLDEIVMGPDMNVTREEILRWI